MNRQSEWQSFRMGDIADIAWGDTSTTKASYVESGYTAYSATGPDGHLPTADYKCSGIVVSAIGAQAGKTWLATGEWSCIKNTLRILPASDQISIEFLYWATRRDNFWPIRGSAQPFISQGDCRDLTIYAPPIRVQQAIADVLGALDDKIAANTKLAATAAQLAHGLFAKAVRESSDEFVLSEITELLSRGITPKYSEGDDTMLILNQKCVRGQRVDLEPARRTLLTKVREDKILKVNDVLVNSTGQGTLGRVARWTGRVRATVDSHITILRFNNDQVDPVTAGMGVLGIQDAIVEMGEGSTGQTELSRTELGKLKVRLPKREQQDTLGLRFAELSRLEFAVLAENQTLAKTRDALLPQLMSGKLRVKEAEALFAAAV